MSYLHWMMLDMYAMGIIAGTYLPRLAGDVRRKYRRSKLQRLIWQARHPRYVRGVNTHMRDFGHYPLTRTPALDDWDCLRCEDRPRNCRPTDEVRRCDCNYKKGMCHCSDSDCDWDPNPITCTCPPDNPCDDACDNTCCADCRYDLGGEG